MVGELIRKELKNSIAKNVLIFLKNGFRFEGVVLDCDDDFVKIKEIKRNSEKFIRLNEILEAEFK